MTTVAIADVRAGCEGVAPLPGRLEPWMVDVLRDPSRLARWIEEHGSPLNLIAPASMERNAAELGAAADAARDRRAEGEPGEARRERCHRQPAARDRRRRAAARSQLGARLR